MATVIAWIVWAAVAQDETAGPEQGAVTVSEVSAEPQAFFGQTVTVSGAVEDFVGENKFLIGEEDIDSSLLVAQRQGQTQVTEGDVIQVTGTVQEVDVAEFEEEFGAFDDGVPEDEFQGTPALVATSINVIARNGGGE